MKTEQKRMDEYLKWCSKNKPALEEFKKELKKKQCEPYTDLIIEMKEGIEWYMDNCRTINKGRSFDETFYNLGANLISRAEDLLNER